MAVKTASKQWYLISVYSGSEDRVAENIKLRTVSMNLQDYVFRVVVVNEEVPVMREGKPVYTEVDGVKVQKTKIKNFFPGYIYVEMIMTDESWHMVRNTEGVTGLVGSSGGGQKPTPVKASEMEKVLKRVGIVDNSMYEQYNVGDLVKVIHGTFENIEAKITAIDKETGVVKVNAVFFGRETPIEVDFSEIVKIQ